MLVEIRYLTTHDSCNNVAYAVVVADLLMLIPRSVLTALSRPLADFIGIFLAVGEEHSARRTCDDLVAVERNAAVVAKSACLLTFISSAQTLGSVLNYQRTVLVADRLDLVDLSGSAVKVSDDHQLYIGVDLKRLFKSDRIHVPGVALGVDEHSFAVFVSDRIDGCIKSHIGTEYLVTLQSSAVWLWHTIQLFACQLDREVQRRSSAGQSNSIFAAC